MILSEINKTQLLICILAPLLVHFICCVARNVFALPWGGPFDIYGTGWIFFKSSYYGLLGLLVGSGVSHREEDVEDWLKILRISKNRIIKRSPTKMNGHVIYPKENISAVGAFPHGLIFCSQRLPYTEKDMESILPNVLKRLPNAQALMVSLHSGIDLVAYDLYVGSELVRSFDGDCLEGATIRRNFGDLQPEERNYFAYAADGKRYFEDPQTYDIYDELEMGETLAFALAGRFFGMPFDDYLFRPDSVTLELLELEPVEQNRTSGPRLPTESEIMEFARNYAAGLYDHLKDSKDV